jgi:hypothetical protein
MGNGGYRFKANGLCLDDSALGLRRYQCQAAYGPYAKYQSWKLHWGGTSTDGRAKLRLQTMSGGGGCLAAVGNDKSTLTLAGCTTQGHTGYERQLWLRTYTY